MTSSPAKKPGTRVFKKCSPNGKITVYLGRRDFVDHITHVDPVDGVVLVDPEYLDKRRVFVHVIASFRYGREDLDVLGLTFRKDLFLATAQVYPPLESNKRPLTPLQERLIKKLGECAYPFYFDIPTNCPASVTLQPAPGDTGKPCGIDYELKAYVGERMSDKANKRNSIRLVIRKVMYAPPQPGEQPSIEVAKEFIMSPSKLHLECSLDKELYYHGEPISINVHIQNNSNKSVKRIRVSVRQFADICLFSTAQYKCTVAELESEEGFPLGSGSTLNKVYMLTPLLSNNKDKWGLALDGQLKHEDTNLASSTLSTEKTENAAIVVQYKVKVKLMLGSLGGELVAELPFTLMHPKPEDEDDDDDREVDDEPAEFDRPPCHASVTPNDNSIREPDLINFDSDHDSPSPLPGLDPDLADPVPQNGHNDHQLTANLVDDDDFEDFARLRLTGEG